MCSLHRFLTLGASLLLLSVSHAESNWPRWRGPAGTGVSSATDLPVQWDNSNVRWKTELIGQGQSSPVVWGDQIFLTAATEGGRNRVVMCLDRESGKLLWHDVAWTGEPEKTNGMNQYASATCATDGKHVVAFFGRGGIHCYDFDGEKLWSRDLGKFEGPWGTASSPIIYEDLVIQNCDAEDKASIVGLDKQTGKTVWETPREKHRGWSSPLLVETPQRTEVVINGDQGVNSYEAKTGEELWFAGGHQGRGTPTVTKFKDILIAVGGRSGNMLAMKPGGTGTIDEAGQVWQTARKGGRDLPSPVVIGQYLVVVSHRPGVATSYDAATGKELGKTRLEGKFSASPIAANGLAYIPNESGDVFVLRPGENLEVVAKNQLDIADEETFRACVTPSQGELLIRSQRVLYCVGN